MGLGLTLRLRSSQRSSHPGWSTCADRAKYLASCARPEQDELEVETLGMLWCHAFR